MSERKGSGVFEAMAGHGRTGAPKPDASVSFVLGVLAAALLTGFVYAVAYVVAWMFGDTPNVPLTFMYVAAWQATLPERPARNADPVLDVTANSALWIVYVYHIWALAAQIPAVTP